MDATACAVVRKALKYGNGEDRSALARALLDQRGLIGQMAGMRFGEDAVKLLLQMVTGRERDEAQAQLMASFAALRGSRYGHAASVGHQAQSK
mmetsp:Transcript_98703/g.262242  ORF Transcript_98703/g.262242 Transcript_98703/m.262242 type:complete len:93 (+) Transcript_98703:3-281(+)